MKLLSRPIVNNDPLKTLDKEELADGGAENDDADIFRNFPIIEDVEMFSDSSKRKRNEDGDDLLRPS